MLNQKGFVPFFLIVCFLIICMVIGVYKLGSSNKEVSSPLVNKPLSSSINNKVVVGSYTVEYPAEYVIESKFGDEFNIVHQGVNGQEVFDSSAGISTYVGDLPRGLKLREWLDMVSTTQPIEPSEDTKLFCKTSKQSLREEISKTPYGGSDNKIVGNFCLFYGVKNIRNIELLNVKNDPEKYINDLEILEFESLNTSGGGGEDTYTIFAYGSGTIWEIYKSNKTSSKNSEINNAYNLLKESFTFRY